MGDTVIARFFGEAGAPRLPPAGAALYELSAESGEFVLVVVPKAPAEALAACTDAEREVLAELLGGRSNREIARRRRRSERTVANQVASVFRRFGVRSRRELLAALGTHLR